MTASILLDSEIDGNFRSAVGGKAAVLGELMRHDLAIPPFFVIRAEVFAKILKNLSDQECCAGESARLLRQILDVALPDDLTMSVKQGLSHIRGSDQEAVAVRSSAVEEDGETASFAGQFETLLGLRTMQEIAAAVRTCWASLMSERAETYRRLRALKRSPHMAVIVQRLIEPESAGVLFTANPVTYSAAEMVIESTFGFGAAVVQGVSTPDVFKVDRHSESISSHTLGSKRRMCVMEHDGPVSIADTPEHLRTTYSLSDAEVLQLVQLGRRIESIMRCPQDIEWAIRRGQVHILQSRPLSARQSV